MATVAAGKEMEGSGLFDMGLLRTHLPKKKRGLSSYFSGKSRSFACLADARCIDDLKKADVQEVKRRKLSNRHTTASVHMLPFSE